MESDKMAKCGFCSVDKNGTACAEKIEKELIAQVRGTKFNDTEKVTGNCAICDKPAKAIVYIARSY